MHRAAFGDAPATRMQTADITAWPKQNRVETAAPAQMLQGGTRRSEEHTSELQSLMRISYAVFCLKKTKYTNNNCNPIPQADRHNQQTRNIINYINNIQ